MPPGGHIIVSGKRKITIWRKDNRKRKDGVGEKDFSAPLILVGSASRGSTFLRFLERAAAS